MKLGPGSITRQHDHGGSLHPMSHKSCKAQQKPISCLTIRFKTTKGTCNSIWIGYESKIRELLLLAPRRQCKVVRIQAPCAILVYKRPHKSRYLLALPLPTLSTGRWALHTTSITLMIGCGRIEGDKVVLPLYCHSR